MSKTDTTEEETQVDKAELMAQVQNLRDEGEKTWEEIGSDLHIAPNRAMFLYMQATVRPKDRIKGKTDEELSAQIVEARDEGKLSWGIIMARSGLSESKCRKLYEQATGQSTKGNRIGKGGRYPAGMEPPAKEKPAPKEKAPKASPAKKAAPAAAKKTASKAPSSKYVGMSYEELQEALAGKAVTYKHAGKQLKIKVTDVADLVGEGDAAEATVENSDGNTAVILVKDIVRVAAR